MEATAGSVHTISPELAPALYQAVRELRRVVRRSLRRSWPLDPLPPAEVELLRLVADQPGVRVGEAAERLRLAPNTVSSLVRRLVDAELLVRIRIDEDARAVGLHPTSMARRRLQHWQDRGAQLFDRSLDQLSATEHDALRHALPALMHLAEVIDRAEDADDQR